VPETTELPLKTTEARREVEDLIQVVKRLEDATARAAQNLAQNPNNQNAGAFFSSASQLAGAQSKLAGVSSTATTGATAANSNPFAAAPRTPMMKLADPGSAGDFIRGLGISNYAKNEALQMIGAGSIPIMASAGSGSGGGGGGNWGFDASGPSSPWNPNNRFAGGMPTSGPSSNIFQGQFQQQQLRSASMLATGAFIGNTALNFATGGMNMLAGNMASGTMNPMGAAGLWGGAGGAVAGGLIGAAIAGPQGYATGAMGPAIMGGIYAGQQLGGSLAQLMMAPYMQAQASSMTLASTARRLGDNPYTMLGLSKMGGFSMENIQSHLQQWTDYARDRVLGLSPKQPAALVPEGLNDYAQQYSFRNKNPAEIALIKMGLYTGADIISTPQYSQVVATVGSGMLSAGIRSKDDVLKVSNRLVDAYGMNAVGMSAMAAPVIGAMNQVTRGGFTPAGGFPGSGTLLGANQTDLLMRFGPEAFGAYRDAMGTGDLTGRQMDSYRDVQRYSYSASIGATAARGSGMAAAAGFAGVQRSLAGLPGGAQSLAYGAAGEQYRNALYTGYGQQDAANFGVPMARLQGAYDRFSVMPYSPGPMLATSLMIGGLANNQANVIEQRLNNLRRSGTLTEAEELNLTQQAESYRTMGAKTIQQLGEGFINRLPAMSAGRPAFAMRMNSVSMAAAASMGSPVLAFGALNGPQMQSQNDFYAGTGGFPAAWSRMQGFNNGGMSMGMSGETNQILQQILSVLQSGSSWSQKGRPGEQNGNRSANIDGKQRQNNDGQVN
jgi:hypothetical protein